MLRELLRSTLYSSSRPFSSSATRDSSFSTLSMSLLPVLREERRSEEHTSELQSRLHLVCRLLLEKKNPPPTQLGTSQCSLAEPRRCWHCIGHRRQRRRSGRLLTRSGNTTEQSRERCQLDRPTPMV